MPIDKFARIIETETHQVLITAEYDADDDEDKVKITANIEGMRMSISITSGEDGYENKIAKLTVKDAEGFVEGMTDEVNSMLGRSAE